VVKKVSCDNSQYVLYQNWDISFSWITGNKVSVWLLFNTKRAIFQLYHGINKWHFDEMMMMMLALY